MRRSADPRGADPVVPPIFLTASFAEHDPGAETTGRQAPYTRYGNPTLAALERSLARLEGAPDGVTFASGMGAIHAVLFTLLGGGAPVVVSRHVYPGTELLLYALADRGVLTPRFVDPDDFDAVRSALDGARLLWLESPANPSLHVADQPGLAALARSAGVPVAVDATLATPVLRQPLRDGAQIVVHSLTKYASGSGDVLGGVVLADRERVELIRATAGGVLGNLLSPLAAHLLARGLDTLPARVTAQSAAALRLAGVLRDHLGAARVRHPTQPGADGRPVGLGAVISFVPDNPDAFLARVPDSELVTRAPSLGDTRTLVSRIIVSRLPPVTRAAVTEVFGPVTDVLRLSVGLEHPDALEKELRRLLGS